MAGRSSSSTFTLTVSMILAGTVIVAVVTAIAADVIWG